MAQLLIYLWSERANCSVHFKYVCMCTCVRVCAHVHVCAMYFSEQMVKGSMSHKDCMA
jgi:hypothetical protein